MANGVYHRFRSVPTPILHHLFSQNHWPISWIMLRYLNTGVQMSAKLGEILVRENLISPQHLREALDYQREHGGRLGFNLVKLGLVSDDMITAVLSRQYGIPSVNLELFQIDSQVLHLIPQEVAQKYSVLPLSRVGASLTLAMVDPDQRLRHGRRQVYDWLER